MAYPPTLPPTTRTDSTISAVNHATDHNTLSLAIQAIIDELGAAPSGEFADLNSRLVALAEDAEAAASITGVAVNALKVGVPGDGSDQTAIIDEVLNTYPVVFFPPEGDYRVTSLAPRSGAVLSGVPGQSRITFISNGAGSNARLRLDNVTDVTLRDLIFSESGVTGRTGFYGVISGNGAARISVVNCEVDSSSSTAAHFINSTDVWFWGGSYHGTEADGLHFQRGCRRVTIIGAHIYDNGDDCIGFVSHGFNAYGYVRDLIVADCILEDTRDGDPGSGIAFIGGIGGILHHNIIRATALSGIRVTPYFDAGEGNAVVGSLIIDGNIIEDVGNYTGSVPGIVREGIYVSDAREVHTTRNRVKRPHASGIVYAGAIIDSSIVGNTVMAPATRGIWLASAKRTGDYLRLWTDPLFTDGRSLTYAAQHGVRIEGNDVISPATDGIYCDGNAGAYTEDLDVTGNRVRGGNSSGSGSTIYGVFVNRSRAARVRRNEVAAKTGATISSYGYANNIDLLREGNLPPVTAEPINIGGKRLYFADITSNPTSGTFELGDEIKSQNPQSGTPYARVCKTSGTMGTLNGGATTASIAAGSTQLTLSSTTGLTTGGYITIAGVTGKKKVIAIADNVATIDSAADATVAGAAVAYSAAAFAVAANLT